MSEGIKRSDQFLTYKSCGIEGERWDKERLIRQKILITLGVSSETKVMEIPQNTILLRCVIGHHQVEKHCDHMVVIKPNRFASSTKPEEMGRGKHYGY